VPIPLLRPGEPFPPGTRANREGLVAVTGVLSADRLVEAYSRGIFPWFERHRHFFWFCPHPRMVLFPDALRVSRSLRRTLARGTFEVRTDTSFREVVRHCASVPRADGSSWISPAFRRAYGDLHDRGLAHSVESWREGRLVGGLYGVSLGGAFMGESMFSLEPDASKVAFAVLVGRLREWGFHFVDCQVHTPHLERLGAVQVPRSRFLAMLRGALREPAAPGPWRMEGPSPIVSARGSEEGTPE
jgi:leucyl/phenylalanyl-tRNA--protein transferase